MVLEDFYSGCLHISLDQERNLTHPIWKHILGEPSLEFQLHHYFPYDNCRRGWLNACCDTNPSTIIHSILFVFFFSFGDYTPLQLQTIVTCGSVKAFWAFFGQFSHLSAHSDKPGRVYKFFRSFGMAISKESHKMHHKAPHENKFCITSGLSEPMVQWVFQHLGYHFKNILFLVLTVDYLVVGLFLGYVAAV